MNSKMVILSGLIAIGLFACNTGPDSPRGFSLPEGNATKGEALFVKYQCLACHKLEGYEDKQMPKQFSPPVQLGGSTTTVKTYAQLVTAIINPSHKLAPRAAILESVANEDGTSKMQVYNDVMTVSELVDIVSFLQPKYKVKPVQYTHYNTYHIP
jgi:mono/diheme cytochrome c family protein